MCFLICCSLFCLWRDAFDEYEEIKHLTTSPKHASIILVSVMFVLYAPDELFKDILQGDEP